MSSEVYEDGEPTIRRSMLLATLFDVLRKSEHPLPSRVALALVADAIEFTPHEASLAAGGVQRAETFLRFGSSWATTLGWMTKKGGWTLTEAGTEALDLITDKSTLYPGRGEAVSAGDQEAKAPTGAGQPCVGQGREGPAIVARRILDRVSRPRRLGQHRRRQCRQVHESAPRS